MNSSEIFALYNSGVSAEPLEIELSLDHQWMYQNIHSQTYSKLRAEIFSITNPLSNSGYSCQWEIILPLDVSIPPATVSVGGSGDQSWTFAAPGCDEPTGISDLGATFQVKVIVTGNDHGNTGSAQMEFGIALLGDVNNDTIVNVADRGITNAIWRGLLGSNSITNSCPLR